MASEGYGLCARFFDRALEPMDAPLRKVAHGLNRLQPGWFVLDLAAERVRRWSWIDNASDALTAADYRETPQAGHFLAY